MESDALEAIRERLDEGWKLLGEESEPWWWPTPTDEAWCEKMREYYPEDAHMPDDALREKYADGRDWQVLWDHVGDAYDDYRRLLGALGHLLDVAESARDVLDDFDYVNEWGYEDGGKSLDDNLHRLRTALRKLEPDDG